MSDEEPRARVLVVDDEQVIHASLRKILEKERYRVDAVHSAEEALAHLASSPCDLVITDLMMPGLGGIALLEALRTRGVQVPVVMITGYPTIRTAVQAMRLGAIDYVAKPFTRRELLGPVRRALRVEEALPAAPDSLAPALTAEQLVPGLEVFLPHHTWARFDQDGTFLIGLEEAFLRVVGAIESVAAPRDTELVEQGHVALHVTCGSGEEHGVAMPLSGQVLEVNRAALADAPQLGPATWLLRLLPTRLADELELLARR